MANLPLTLVCAGCGSWVQLDVKRTGSLVVLLLCFITFGLAYFSPYFLILLPLYLVLSMGPLQSFSVSLVKKRKADLWTINRISGALRPLNDAERDAEHDVQLSRKLSGVRPFKAVSGGKKFSRTKDDTECRPYRTHKRPKYSLDDLPTGLPN